MLHVFIFQSPGMIQRLQLKRRIMWRKEMLVPCSLLIHILPAIQDNPILQRCVYNHSNKFFLSAASGGLSIPDYQSMPGDS